MFPETELDRRLRLGLEATGHGQATEVQQAVLTPALAGRDVLVSAATGSGKTLAYLVPAAQRILAAEGRAKSGALLLVLTPTRELARQVASVCTALTEKSPLRVEVITGGAEQKYQRAQLRRDPEVVVGTPGRLLEMCQKKALDLSALSTLVIDEADRMLDLGMQEEVLAILEHLPAAKPQVMLLSATLKHRGLSAVIKHALNDPAEVRIGPRRRAHSNIQHQRILADHEAHKEELLLALAGDERYRKILVFTNKRVRSEKLAGNLRAAGLRSAALHGEMSTEDRKRVVNQLREGALRVVCASDVAARGLDIDGIDLVINFDVPTSGDDYLHRSGRTGRGSAEGVAISLVQAREWNLMASIQRYLGETFELLALPGLKARYAGPRKVKGSGKAAGKKKKATPGKKSAAGKKAATKSRRKPAGIGGTKPSGGAGDGFAPLKRR